MLLKLYKYTLLTFLGCAFFALPGQAQELSQATGTPDSVQAPVPFVPRVSYGLNAGAAISNFGSASFVEPRVQYSVTPRFSVFSSLTMMQTWGGPTFRTTGGPEGGTTLMNAAPDRQYLLHVGGTYAMSERLLVSGSVWKDLNASAMNRWQSNPFTYGRYPSQGFQVNAQYQVAPNVTIGGGIRYSNGGNAGFGGYPGAGFNSPWGF